jgi:hypothetical protein
MTTALEREPPGSCCARMGRARPPARSHDCRFERPAHSTHGAGAWLKRPRRSSRWAPTRRCSYPFEEPRVPRSGEIAGCRAKRKPGHRPYGRRSGVLVPMQGLASDERRGTSASRPGQSGVVAAAERSLTPKPIAALAGSNQPGTRHSGAPKRSASAAGPPCLCSSPVSDMCRPVRDARIRAVAALVFDAANGWSRHAGGPRVRK